MALSCPGLNEPNPKYLLSVASAFILALHMAGGTKVASALEANGQLWEQTTSIVVLVSTVTAGRDLPPQFEIEFNYTRKSCHAQCMQMGIPRNRRLLKIVEGRALGGGGAPCYMMQYCLHVLSYFSRLIYPAG